MAEAWKMAQDISTLAMDETLIRHNIHPAKLPSCLLSSLLVLLPQTRVFNMPIMRTGI